MRVVLATGLEELERETRALLEAEGFGVVECYYREALAKLVKDESASVVVYSLHLIGQEDHLDVLRAVRELGARVVFLPGNREDVGAVNLARRAVALGIYDLVWDKVYPVKIVDRVKNPATLADVGVTPDVEAVDGLIPEGSKGGASSDNLLKKLWRRPASRPAPESMPEEEAGWTSGSGAGKYPDAGSFVSPGMEAAEEREGVGGAASGLPAEGKPKGRKTGFPLPSFRGFFSRSKKPMLLTDCGLEEIDAFDALNVLPAHCKAVFLPAGTARDVLPAARRDPKFRTVLFVVVGGGKEFLRLGADRVVRRVTDGVVQEAAVLAERLRDLWLGAETDQLTGCYTRRFWDAWLKEQVETGRHFSVALVDLDHFKKVNDTLGHQAGDAVLAAFGEFLRSRTRVTDVVARYGGEEFAVGLAYTGAAGGAVLIDRLRKEWAAHEVPVPGGKTLKCTFSAGVAEHAFKKDVMAEADAMLYRAKEAGRNRVEKAVSQTKKVLLLGMRVSGLEVHLREMGVPVTSDPADASCVLADFTSYGLAPEGIPLVVVGSGTVADFAVKRTRPDALVCASPEEAVAKAAILVKGEIIPERRDFSAQVVAEKVVPDHPARVSPLTVLPGGRASEKGQVIPEHSALYVACPSRPALAGETAASIARSVCNAALVCATVNCTGALAIGLSPEDLILADWRVPGSSAPVEVDGVHVWPVDPLKFLDARESAHALVDRIRNLFSLVVVDCGGGLDACARAQKTDGIMILQTAGDLADQVVRHWLRNYGGPNVFVLPPGMSPKVVAGENGFVILGGEVVAGVRRV